MIWLSYKTIAFLQFDRNLIGLNSKLHMFTLDDAIDNAAGNAIEEEN